MTTLENAGDYTFDIEAQLTSEPLGEVPEGFRLDLWYDTHGSRVVRDKNKIKDAKKFPPLDGTLVSGGDRVTVYNHGVVKLNGRATLSFPSTPNPAAHGGAAPPRPFLVDMLYSGVLDLGDGTAEKGTEMFQLWKQGRLPYDTLGLALAITFELATQSKSFAEARYNAPNPEDYKRFAHLARAQHIALGTVEIDHKPYSPLGKLKLVVLALDVPAAGRARS